MSPPGLRSSGTRHSLQTCAPAALHAPNVYPATTTSLYSLTVSASSTNSTQSQRSSSPEVTDPVHELNKDTASIPASLNRIAPEQGGDNGHFETKIAILPTRTRNRSLTYDPHLEPLYIQCIGCAKGDVMLKHTPSALDTVKCRHCGQSSHIPCIIEQFDYVPQAGCDEAKWGCPACHGIELWTDD